MSEIVINGYEINILGSQSAGNSEWGYALKNGKKFFVKKLKDTYPDIEYSKANSYQKESIEISRSFEDRIRRLYHDLNISNTGNLIVPIEFLKYEGHYYVVTEWIEQFSKFDEIKTFTDYQKNLMMRVLAYSLYGLECGHIVHSDLKPDNIRIKDTASDAKTLKIIDFENGFIEGEYPDVVGGDQNYMSPELFVRMQQDELIEDDSEKIPITTKSDIFALGIIFHEILTGELPIISDKEIMYAGIAKLKDKDVILSPKLPNAYSELIKLMISLEPDERPRAFDIFKYLKENVDPLNLR